MLFHVSPADIIPRFDALTRLDVYMQPPLQRFMVLQADCFEVSDLAKNELVKTKPTFEPKELPQLTGITSNENGIFRDSTTAASQLISVIHGFLGLVKEFSYDQGVDPRIFIVSGTKFVIDTTKSSPQLIHNIRRSYSPNCLVQLFKYQHQVLVGLFAGIAEANAIDKRSRREKFSIPPNTELTIPFDFAPGVLIEPEEFFNWKLNEIEVDEKIEPVQTEPKPPPKVTTPTGSKAAVPKLTRPTPEEREASVVVRQFERTTTTKKTKTITTSKVKPYSSKMKIGASHKHHIQPPEESFFEFLKSPTQPSFSFSLVDWLTPEADPPDITGEVKEELTEESHDVDLSWLEPIRLKNSHPFTPYYPENPFPELTQLLLGINSNQ